MCCVLQRHIQTLLRTPQIASTVVGGGRLAVPPPDQLPGPEGGDLPGLDRYLALMRDCWEGDPERRPTFAEIVPRLRWGGAAGR